MITTWPDSLFHFLKLHLRDLVISVTAFHCLVAVCPALIVLHVDLCARLNKTTLTLKEDAVNVSGVLPASEQLISECSTAALPLQHLGLSYFLHLNGPSQRLEMSRHLRPLLAAATRQLIS